MESNDIPLYMTHRNMVNWIGSIRGYNNKIAASEQFYYDDSHSYWIHNSIRDLTKKIKAEPQKINTICAKVHYGCANNLFQGWLNIDMGKKDVPGYLQLNLIDEHPFPDDSIKFGFSEDMLEHFSQAEGIFFLSEVFRTLMHGGVLRLNIPSLEQAFKYLYPPFTRSTIRNAEIQAYTVAEHLHLYTKEELSFIAEHLGFSKIEFVEYNKSKYNELCNLELRDSERLRVELTK